MKIRSDFVSNSSSCSFIIKVNSKDEIQVLADFFKKHPGICSSGYPNIEFAAENVWDRINCINPECIGVGECLYVNVGEDHDMRTIDKFYKISEEIEELGVELYEDPGAHYSVGAKLPEIKD